MEDEYVFNYDEIKQKFESVPQTNSTTKILYKTHFQARTTTTTINETRSMQTRSNTYPLMANQIKRKPSTITFKAYLHQVIPIEQSQKGFFLKPKVMK